MMPSGDNNPNGAMPGASRVGAELRAARLRLGRALPAIAADLHIRLPFLQALEDGRVADLPGNVYAIGFLRSYATTLGLDVAEMTRRFRAEAQDVSRKTELAFPVPMPDRSVPVGAVVLLGVLLTLGAYAGWYRFSGDAPSTAEVVPAVPERLAPLAEPAAPPANLPLPTPSPPNVSPPSVPPQIAAVLPGPSTSALAAPMSVPPSTAPAPITAPVATPDLPAVATINEGRIMLRVNADAWIQVRERQGQVLLSRIMRAGDVWPVPKGTQLLLSTGNAGGTELLVDGEATPALGGSGAIRRDIPLDPDALKGGSTARPAAQ